MVLEVCRQLQLLHAAVLSNQLCAKVLFCTVFVISFQVGDTCQAHDTHAYVHAGIAMPAVCAYIAYIHTCIHTYHSLR